MKPLRWHGGKLLHRAYADFEMLAHLRPVERRCHAGKLQLAMERLVRNAQQRSIGHAEAEAVCGDRRRFHVERDRA